MSGNKKKKKELPHPKRHGFDVAEALSSIPSGAYQNGLWHPEYAKSLALIVSGFEHFEERMHYLLALLMGTPDLKTAGYIWRSLPNSYQRLALLRELLQQAPINKNKGREFDELIKKYDRVRVRRNEYVHGLWYTAFGGEEVKLARKKDHGWGFAFAVEEPLDGLKSLINEITEVSDTLTKLLLAFGSFLPTYEFHHYTERPLLKKKSGRA